MIKPILRWIMVVPGALVGTYLVFLICALSVLHLEKLCSRRIPSNCGSWWELIFISVIYIVFPGLAAFSMVTCPALIAPSLKNRVARCAYYIGAFIALFLAGFIWYIDREDFEFRRFVFTALALIVSLVIGRLTVLWISRRFPADTRGK